MSTRGTIFPWRSGNRFELLIDGPQFFPRMLVAIARAEEQVELELYLVEAGACAEAMVQALVLGHSHFYPELTQNKGNIALLKKAGELGLLPANLANYVADAYRQLRAKQHALRLAGHDKSRTSDPAMMVLRKPIRTLWATLLGEEST